MEEENKGQLIMSSTNPYRAAEQSIVIDFLLPIFRESNHMHTPSKTEWVELNIVCIIHDLRLNS